MDQEAQKVLEEIFKEIRAIDEEMTWEEFLAEIQFELNTDDLNINN